MNKQEYNDKRRTKGKQEIKKIVRKDETIIKRRRRNEEDKNNIRQ